MEKTRGEKPADRKQRAAWVSYLFSPMFFTVPGPAGRRPTQHVNLIRS
jgi:hypothetical protein